MPCSGFLEMLENRARAESFSQNVLQDIREYKKRLEKKIATLRIKGDQYQAKRAEETVAYLNRVETRIKEIVEA